MAYGSLEVAQKITVVNQPFCEINIDMLDSPPTWSQIHPHPLLSPPLKRDSKRVFQALFGTKCSKLKLRIYGKYLKFSPPNYTTYTVFT